MKCNSTNIVMQGCSGRFENMVFYQRNENTFIRKAQRDYDKTPSAKQSVSRNDFREAHLFARAVIADPVRKAEYAKKGKRKGWSAYTAALSEYLRMLKQSREVEANKAQDDNAEPVSATWTGASNNNWHNLSNWSGGFIPGKNTDVIIGRGAVHLNADGICRTINIQPGVTFVTSAGATLTIVESS